ncbi:MAG: PHP domain-containing protein [Ferruginibacter sp.]
MTNIEISDTLSTFSKLMDIHGENSFKSKSLSIAAFTIEKYYKPISELPESEIANIKGIGISTSQKIIELLKTGKIQAYENLLEATPQGILEMILIKGLGPKKINSIWKDMEIGNLGELLYACKENRLKSFKGFGEKTQLAIMQKIEFYQNSKGRFLYARTLKAEEYIRTNLESFFGVNNVFITGSFARQLEIIDELEYIIVKNIEEIKLIDLFDFKMIKSDSNSCTFMTEAGLKIVLHSSSNTHKFYTSILKSSSNEFLELIDCNNEEIKAGISEEDVFLKAGLPYVHPFLRENKDVVKKMNENYLPIHQNDIKGIIHCHSDWSDGNNTIEELAIACITKGFEYLVISDHSKSAFYAHGLYEDKIKQQHILIDELNAKLHPFKILKSIESDILNDGSLDYSNNILSTFDLVIASVHSNLNMTEEKATGRLLKAIENPYTTILGHLTGRLLLSRAGYPVNYNKIIDACIANDVAIELNAHPNRLDIDWRYLNMIIDRGGIISIDPDAHYIEGLDDVKYGVIVAQKGMITKAHNLSCYSINELEEYLGERRIKKSI